MRINPILIKESLDREAQKKVKRGEILSEAIYASVAAEILYCHFEDKFPPETYIALADTVISWLKCKQRIPAVV